MASTTRTFVAVAVPAALGRKLARLQSLLAPELPAAHWTTALPFHLTLAFLGDVANTDLNEICRATAEVVAPLAPWDLRLEGFGAFPDATRPRVLWVGANGPGVAALEALQGAVVAATRAAGHAPEDDRFHPHVTLGRLKPGRKRGPSPDITPLVKHYATWSPGSFTVSEAVVFASTLTSEGPEYAPLGRAPLEGGKPGQNA